MLKIEIAYKEVNEKDGSEQLVAKGEAHSVLAGEAEVVNLARFYHKWHADRECQVGGCKELATVVTESEDQYCEKHGAAAEATAEAKLD